MELESIVRSWDNCNLSVHNDFAALRATTENMARLLCFKLQAAFRGIEFTVQVRENPEIEVTYP